MHSTLKGRNRSGKIARWVFMLDTDNTLWDANATFTKAQTAILTELERNGLCVVGKDGLKVLRRLDDKLIAYYGRFEYDFKVLILALKFFSEGYSENNSVRKAIGITREEVPRHLGPIVTRAHRAFRRQLQQVPPLGRGVKSTLRTIRQRPSVVCLFSEGKRARIARIVEALSLREYYDHLYVGKKTEELYRQALRQAMKRLRVRSQSDLKVMVVGDLLDRDIRVGNEIGAVTVLRLGGYKLRQRPRDKLEKPDYVIEQMPELVRIVEQEEKRAR